MKSLLIALVLGFNAFTGNTDVEPVTTLHAQITNSISFPEFAKDQNISDKVNVQFRVDENYKINVVNVAAESAMLVDHVKNQLEGVKVNSAEVEVGKLYGVAVSFTIL